MRHLTVRGVPPSLARALEREARDRGQSLNQTVKELLERALGLPSGSYDNGLRRFAGTWTDAELSRFERATARFESVDEELWK
jgi:hypothetical protein